MTGGLSVMDTEDIGVETRALELAVDDAQHTVRQAHVWGLRRHCEHEGSSYPLANGGMLTACATAHIVDEYPAGSSEPIWTLTAHANGDTLPRAIPITLP
jgi:hypothetical protein